MITIYKDSEANAIFIQDANGVQFLNSLQATVENSLCSIADIARDLNITSDLVYSDYIDESGNAYGNNAVETCNALNAIFSSSGTSTSNMPAITSSLAVSMTAGDVLNYELVADYGVGYEWDLSNVTGITTVEGNPRKLIGGSGIAGGTYNIPVKAINYNGEDSETLVLTISSPSYSNTKSVLFNNNDYLDATASTSNPFYRASNGAGSGDAWTMAGWFRSGGNGQSEQTLISYGGNNENNEGRVSVLYDGSGGDKKFILRYGSNNNKLVLKTPSLSHLHNTWAHIMITYDGGTTGDSSGNLADYYGRFEIWLDGVSQTLTESHANYGWTGEIKAEHFRLGEQVSGGKHMRGCNLDELAIWSGDETANVAAIYNSGTLHDLALLSSAPDHYWRMGDGDTYPTIGDAIGSLDFTMNNMTSADIVNDVP